MTVPAETLEARITELEMRLAFADDSIEALQHQNQAQQGELEYLQEQLVILKERLLAMTPSPLDGETQARHELPPHY